MTSTNEQTTDRGPTNVEKLRGLPWGVAWSVTNSVFAQLTFFGSIFVLLLNALGLDKAQIGGLLALLPFFGIVALFIATPVARLGVKRVFLASMAARTTTAALLLLTPLILARFGPEAILAFIVATVAIFALFRAIGFTAFYPWLQEQVPDGLRGKYTAVKNALASLSAFLAMIAAGYVLGPDPGLGRFMILVVVGVVFGLISVWVATRIPGGAPAPPDAEEPESWRGMAGAARDPNFVRYLVGAALVTLATAPLVSFVPLFMKEQVGLSADQVVWLETGVLLGGLVSSYLWGWLADRYGSKPVMVSSLFMLPLLPLAWLLMPRGSAWGLPLALAIAFGQGLVNTGWGISSGRLLFVRVVPAERKTPYMALYYAWMGVAGGLSQLLGGWLVDLTEGVSGQWWVFRLDAYTLLFVMGLVLPLASALLLRRVRADSGVTPRQFAGMFLRGNPFLALESLVRYHRARDERAAVAMTGRLGSTKSPLTDEELIEALHDPRFFVRVEAIVSITRHRPDPQLSDALIETLEGPEPALSTLAAWALGRIGDERAVEALRRGLEARYQSVRAHCARSLGSLGDTTVQPLLLERLAVEEDVGLQMAYAAALGKLEATEAIDRLLELLRATHAPGVRNEFALALARLVGEEHGYIQLQRRAGAEPGTALSQAVTAVRGRVVKAQAEGGEGLAAALDAAAEALARDDLPGGVALLCQALRLLPAGKPAAPCRAVLKECLARMEELGAERIEYVVLGLHALECGVGG